MTKLADFVYGCDGWVGCEAQIEMDHEMANPEGWEVDYEQWSNSHDGEDHYCPSCTENRHFNMIDMMEIG